MTNPYEPPQTQEHLKLLKKKRGCMEPVLGCTVGGCCIPIFLLILSSAFLGGGGGLFLLPVISIVLGTIGIIIGFGYRSRR